MHIECPRWRKYVVPCYRLKYKFCVRMPPSSVLFPDVCKHKSWHVTFEIVYTHSLLPCMHVSMYGVTRPHKMMLSIDIRGRSQLSTFMKAYTA